MTTTDGPRAYTTDEVAERFLGHLAVLARYWRDEERAPTAEEKLTGMGHSFLTMLDGMSGDMPAWKVRPWPHSDDEAFHRDEGENWYPSGDQAEDIAGGLHEQWHAACTAAGLTGERTTVAPVAALLKALDDLPHLRYLVRQRDRAARVALAQDLQVLATQLLLVDRDN